MLHFISPEDRDLWVTAAMSVKSEFGDDGFSAWDNWSQGGSSYNARDAKDVWKSIKAGGKTTIATLIKQAIDGGYKFTSDHKEPTPEELAERKANRDAEAEAERIKTEERQQRAAIEAGQIFNDGDPDSVNEHSYIQKKGISAFGGVRVGSWPRYANGQNYIINNALLIPIYSSNRVISSLQAIFENDNNPLGRDRDFLPGGKKAGGYLPIGKLNTDAPKVIICEGYATGCSIYKAMNIQTIVAFDAGNLELVARMVREKLPDARIIIAADNDQYGAVNTGVREAHNAATAIGGIACVPRFASADGKPTDFNDLAQREGLEAVKKQIEQALSAKDKLENAQASAKSGINRLRDAGVEILGGNAANGIWLSIANSPAEKYQIKDLLKKATLLSIAPRAVWDDLVTITDQGQRFTADAAASALSIIASTLPAYTPPAPKVIDLVEDDDQLTGVQGRDSYIIAKRLADHTIYDSTAGHWYGWKTVWRRIGEEQVRGYVVKHADSDLDREYDNGYITGMTKLLCTRLNRSPEIHGDTNNDIWDNDRNLLPLKNGVLDITTREIFPHSPNYMFNWMIPHEYIPGAECSSILDFIFELANKDWDTYSVLLAFLAAVLHGRYDLSRYLELVGMAGTGKSTFISLCQELVGDENTAITDMKTLHNNQFETANIYGKRLVIIADADKYGGDIGVFKQITGKDKVRREEKNKQAQAAFVFKGMVVVAANNPIQFNDSSTAMVRRRVSVHIDHKLDKTKIDHNLNAKLKAEIPGLINELLGFPQDAITRVLSDADYIRHSASMRAMIETNSVAAWANEWLIADTNGVAKVGNLKNDYSQCLYPNYAHYLEATGRKGLVALNTFSRTLQDVLSAASIPLEFKTTNTGRHVIGLRLRTDTVADSEIPRLILK